MPQWMRARSPCTCANSRAMRIRCADGVSTHCSPAAAPRLSASAPAVSEAQRQETRDGSAWIEWLKSELAGKRAEDGISEGAVDSVDEWVFATNPDSFFEHFEGGSAGVSVRRQAPSRSANPDKLWILDPATYRLEYKETTIEKGEVLIVDTSQHEPVEGQLFVAPTRGALTVGRLHRKGNQWLSQLRRAPVAACLPRRDSGYSGSACRHSCEAPGEARSDARGRNHRSASCTSRPGSVLPLPWRERALYRTHRAAPGHAGEAADDVPSGTRPLDRRIEPHGSLQI